MISAFVLGLLPGIGPSAGCALLYRVRLAGAHARSAWRRGIGAAVLCSPSTNAASACKGPLFQYSMLRGDRYPNQDSRIFRGLSYVKIRVFTLGEPTRAPNSRIYDVGSLYSKVRKVRGYANPCSMDSVGVVSQIFRVSTPALEGDYRKQTQFLGLKAFIITGPVTG